MPSREISSTRLRPVAGLLATLGAIVSISLLSGCQFGRCTMGMNREHLVPFPEMTMLPFQSEPPLDAK